MFYLPSKEMDINKFVDVKLPTKRQLFSRLGASAPGRLFSGDDPVPIGLKPTEQADEFVKAAEAYDPSNVDLPAEDENS